jgi:hypothetical protein
MSLTKIDIVNSIYEQLGISRKVSRSSEHKYSYVK